jgi:hypothetical protein
MMTKISYKVIRPGLYSRRKADRYRLCVRAARLSAPRAELSTDPMSPQGDRQLLEYTKAGDGARLALIVLHDDAAATNGSAFAGLNANSKGIAAILLCPIRPAGYSNEVWLEAVLDADRLGYPFRWTT